MADKTGMFPELPEDLAALTDEDLATLADEFKAVAREVKARDEETLGERTAEQIVSELNAGVEAIELIKAEQEARAEAEQNFQAELERLTSRAGVEDEASEEDGDAETAEDAADGEAADAETETEAEAEAAEVLEPIAASTKAVRRPLPAARRHRPQASMVPEGTQLLASSQVYPFSDAGEALTSRRLAEISVDMINKNRINPGMKVVLASATYPFPVERMLDRDMGLNAQKIDNVLAPQALVASGGLCAPLTPIYSMPSVRDSGPARTGRARRLPR